MKSRLCEICNKEIPRYRDSELGFKKNDCVRLLYYNSDGIRIKEFYHKKCFNKNFIVRDLKDNKICICDYEFISENGLEENRIYVDYGFLNYGNAFRLSTEWNKMHIDCFKKYWMIGK